MSHDPLAMIEYRSDPAFFILGDSPEAVARWRDAAESAGVAVRGTNETLSADIDLPVTSVPLLVEIEGDADREVLDRLRAEAEAGRRFALSASLAAMDDEAVWHPNIIPSCQPSAMERLQAIAILVIPPSARLHDVGRDSHDMLRKLSEDVGRIAETLASLAEEPQGYRGEGEDEALDAGTIRALIRARRMRENYFPASLFADPAWDMLLDLMAARLEGTPVAVSSLCIASAVPATTALRWIRTLTDRGLLVRVADPRDGRRVFIDLSDQTARALGAYLRSARRITPLIV
jgi:Winged helix DNA-binding domain